MAPQIAISNIQNANGVRVSTDPARVPKSACANTATAQITMAIVTIIAAESPSARNAMPSGGFQSPTM